MNKSHTLFAGAALIALNGRFGFGNGLIMYFGAGLGALCLVGAVVSNPWLQQRGLEPSPFKPVPITRLLLVVALAVGLGHAIDSWAYPALSLSAQLAIDLLAFGTALMTFAVILHIRKRIARSVV